MDQSKLVVPGLGFARGVVAFEARGGEQTWYKADGAHPPGSPTVALPEPQAILPQGGVVLFVPPDDWQRMKSFGAKLTPQPNPAGLVVVPGGGA